MISFLNLCFIALGIWAGTVGLQKKFQELSQHKLEEFKQTTYEKSGQKL